MYLYANSVGELLRFLQTEEEEIAWPDPPKDDTEHLKFDGATNPIIVQRLNVDWNNHRLISGQLFYKEQLIIINPPSNDFNEHKAALILAHTLRDYNGLSSPTNAQSIQAIQANNRLTLLIGKMFLRELKE